MSTNDCPGYDPKNRDELAMGCWAEHEDGSLIFVESTEDDRVIYALFDLAASPVIEYRDSMAIGAFKKNFSWSASDKALLSGIKWTWHDKTPFPWDRVIRRGARDGVRMPHVDDQLTAAERVRRSREIHRGRPVDDAEVRHRVERTEGKDKAAAILDKLQRAISELMR
jgi:hypothetical protein